MKEQWVMTLRSIQREEKDQSDTTLDTEVLYTTEESGDRVIVYEESETTGMEGSRTELRVSPDGMVSSRRTGPYETHLGGQKGVKHFCHYDTPFGGFTVGVSARYVHSTLTDEGGDLEMRYTVDANSTLLSDNEILLHLEKICI